MTANVTIEITRRENVLRVPVPALRFRPTSEIFEALGVAEPADLRARPPVQQTPDVLPASLETRMDSTRRNATTIDGLFGELRVEPVPGRVWTYSDGSGGARSLKAIDVHTGISDGTWAELLDGSQLAEGRVLVSNVDTGRPNVVRPSTSPLMPGRPGGDHGGGHGGPH
jgi:hypothetical protein